MQNVCKTSFECSYDHGQALGWLAEGLNINTMATAVGASKSAISQFKKAAEDGNAMQKHADGCRKIIISQEN